MQTHLECLACFVRQALEAARLAGDDADMHARVMRRVLSAASEMDFSWPPPKMARRIHQIIRDESGCDDPYRTVKAHSNRLARHLYPVLKRRVRHAPDPFAAAVRLAVAGNVMDFGAPQDERRDRQEQLFASFEQALNSTVAAAQIDTLREAVHAASSILYIADNAGEIGLDRILIEELPGARVTLAVRGAPILNDATLADAEEMELHQVADVITSGSDCPGTILSECSEQFRQCFDEADLLIVKGQGNYETLNDCGKEAFFLLKIKCPVIARATGCPQGCMAVLACAGEAAAACASTHAAQGQ